MRNLSLASFIFTVRSMINGVTYETKRGLQAAGDDIVQHARAKLGHYQRAVGPFPAWKPLAESTKDDRVKKGFAADEPGLRTGEMRDSIRVEVKVTGRGEGHVRITSDDPHMAYFEIGTRTQPPRSVLGATLFEREQMVAKIAAKHAVRAIVDSALADSIVRMPRSR